MPDWLWVGAWLVLGTVGAFIAVTAVVCTYRLIRGQIHGPNSTAKVGERVVVVKNGEALVPPLHTRIMNLFKAR